MPYQYKREPLSDDEANQFTDACETFYEKLVVWTLLETDLRVSELANLKKESILWQERRLVIYGKGHPCGKKTRRWILSMTDCIKRLIDHHFAEHDNRGISSRTIQRSVKVVTNKADISKPVTPQVLRHTFSIDCIKKGISTRALTALLGHDRLATTEIYLNLSLRRMRSESFRISGNPNGTYNSF
jgi:integrase/recombinase XerD